MAERNRDKRRNVWLTIGVSCLAVSALCVALASPETAMAKKPSNPGGGKEPIARFTITMAKDEAFTFEAPTYLPPETCVATTVGTTAEKYWGFYGRHDLDATVTTDSGYELTDDISFEVNTDRDGRIISFQLFGQDTIGTEGIMHHSEVVDIDPPVTPSDAGFTLHVDTDNLPIWKTNRHLKQRGAKRIEVVGLISVSDLVYAPLPQ